jgi:hypothetical protein
MGLLAQLRGPKIANMAVFDWVATGLVAIGASALFGRPSMAPAVFIVLIIMAIIVHDALGVPTMLNAYLGLAKKDDVLAARERAST